MLHRNRDGKTVYEAYHLDAIKEATTGKCTGSTLDEVAIEIE